MDAGMELQRRLEALLPVQGAHDMYRTGEYMIWTDGTTQHCTRDTAYGPDGDPTAWEVLQDSAVRAGHDKILNS